ncbi:glycosyltransferase family 4 protein [Polynucleobacter sp. AP-Kaivos-20-H2]|uniref:glycosyltransferase family 4 protein n=1 Tax=Polynucleobacter sp. AP-Kaivos-20-H2 TaxID=2689104 RepID=UPI001C0E801C|nr:glycosyltransferase family 4 protein [Polynucleobacter sp. AP-Kaivos-20-H2]MBU3604096.1 glycosyltransferase family 4 protein [Polynucleobacter sp. AP-Kaivos-20-H2]
MRVFALNLSDSVGGAAKAAYRIHQAVRGVGVNSSLIVHRKISNDPHIIGPKTNLEIFFDRFRSGVGVLVARLIRARNGDYHSPAMFPTSWSKRLNQSSADVVHLHWIHGEMMSVEDLGSIDKPLVWTLHDMWAFSGAEHYSEDLRWKEGYTQGNRPRDEAGFDLNRWTWLRKQKAWKNPIQIVTPSQWLASCVKNSALMRNWPVEVIPNPIDVNQWAPIDKKIAREKLDLPQDVPLILFGAIGGAADPRKGFDLLQEALQKLSGKIDSLELVVFGQAAPTQPVDLGFPVHYLGHLASEVDMQMAYSAADALIAPSRQEVFGQTASEAHACGRPVVAFEGTGLADVIEHQKTGYLAKAGNVQDLANGITWVLESISQSNALNVAARKRAVEKFSYPVVAQQYQDIYSKVIKSKHKPQ